MFQHKVPMAKKFWVQALMKVFSKFPMLFSFLEAPFDNSSQILYNIEVRTVGRSLEHIDATFLKKFELFLLKMMKNMAMGAASVAAIGALSASVYYM